MALWGLRFGIFFLKGMVLIFILQGPLCNIWKYEAKLVTSQNFGFGIAVIIIKIKKEYMMFNP